jgi:GNAT superfamily N-acetyltransferase
MTLRARFDPETSHELERLAARGWPADEIHEVEGWLLRRTEGVDRRRCNSMLPPAGPAHAARTGDLALATAEELGMPPVIQVAPAEGHTLLDDALAARGMAPSGPSLVLAGPLSARAATRRPGVTGSRALAPMGAARPGHAPRRPGRDSRAAAGDGPLTMGPLDPAWVDAWAAVSGLDGTRETAELVLARLGDRGRFAVRRDGDGAPLAVGIGVVEDGWLGMFSLATAPAARRHGVASEVVDALEGWAATRGAARIYLQVERDNAAALAFYERRGLSIAHTYHYRSA